MKEEFRDIVGYEGLYQVSNLGNIKSLPKLHITTKNNNNIGYISKDKILKTRITKRGYCLVTLYKNKIAKSLYVHKIVAETFIPNLENKTCVNHINGDKTDNRKDNLEWCTYSENMKHAYATGLNYYA